MLGTHDVQATVAVKSLATARPFYEQVLGLTPEGDAAMGVQAFRAGSVTVVVYESDFAGTNKATSLTWALGASFDETIKGLQARNVAFEHYADMPGVTLEGDVHRIGGMRLAWFKDPDGNIIHLGDF